MSYSNWNLKKFDFFALKIIVFWNIYIVRSSAVLERAIKQFPILDTIYLLGWVVGGGRVVVVCASVTSGVAETNINYSSSKSKLCNI